MRIKFLQDFGPHTKGAFLVPDDEKVAKQYVAAGVAEEAPEAEDLATTVKNMLVAALGDFQKGVTAAGKSFGPRIGDISGGESEHDRKKSLGHQCALIGVVGNNESTPAERENANNVLKNLYGSTYRPWTKDDYSASQVVGKASTQVEGTGTLGGYGVYPEYSTNLYKIAIENTVFASMAKRQPMASNSFFYPKLNQTGTQAAGVTGYLGGIVLWWGSEASNINKTNAQLEQGELKAGKLQGYTQISMETIADNQIGLESQINELVRDGVGYYIDYATLMGDGVDKPLGVLNAPCAVQYTRAGGAGTQTVAYTDLTGLKRRILPQYRKGAFYIVSLSAEDALWNMADGAGRPLFLPNAVGSTQVGAIGADVGTGQPLLGLPYVITEKTPIFGSTGDIACVAPQGYILGERMGLEMTASNAPGFLTGLMTYRFVARVAGQPILDKPFTLLDGTTKASTFSVLV